MNLVLDHGCGFRDYLQFLEDDGETPINMTGGTLKAEVRPEPGGVLLGSFTFEWDDITEGTFYQVMAAADVNDIPDGVHSWDLIFTDSTGVPHKLDSGTCTKRGTITELP
jgi:hypothetical protein